MEPQGFDLCSRMSRMVISGGGERRRWSKCREGRSERFSICSARGPDQAPRWRRDADGDPRIQSLERGDPPSKPKVKVQVLSALSK